MNFEKYLIKKDKTDLLSSLKALDKEIVEDEMENYDVDSLEDLKEEIIYDFVDCLDVSKNNFFTKEYFKKILRDENSSLMSVCMDDIEAMWAFVYENNGHISYYIADEVKDIIKKVLKIQ